MNDEGILLFSFVVSECITASEAVLTCGWCSAALNEIDRKPTFIAISIVAAHIRDYTI